MEAERKLYFEQNESFVYLENRGDHYLIIRNFADRDIPLMAEQVFFRTAEECEKDVSRFRKSRWWDFQSGCFTMKPDGFKSVNDIPSLPVPDIKHYAVGGYHDYVNDEYKLPQIAELLVKGILNDPALPSIKHVRIGDYGQVYSWDDRDGFGTLFSAMIVENKEKFQHLESLYVGDIDPPYADISGLPHPDYDEVLKSLPHLKSFTMKGIPSRLAKDGEALCHPALETLEIITGGLSKHIVAALQNAQLSKLKKLMIYVGDENYGLDVSSKALMPLAQKSLFPNLQYLGFVNSSEQNEIASLLMDSDILPQLEVLNLSFGGLHDKGGQVLLDNAEKLAHLKQVVIDYHFLSDEMVKKLEASPMKVCISNPQEADDWDGQVYYYPMITE